MSKVIYVAHPLSGDIEGNTRKVCEIMAKLTRLYPEDCFVAPYLACLQYLDDTDEKSREAGLAIDQRHFQRNFVDELWIFGENWTKGQPLSDGVKREIGWANEFDIPHYFCLFEQPPAGELPVDGPVVKYVLYEGDE